MKCDQCEMLSINGVACHEIGCPNSKKNLGGRTPGMGSFHRVLRLRL